MKRIAALTVAAFITLSPAAAQEGRDAPDAGRDMDEALDLLGEGLREFFESLTQELEPALREFATEMQPAMRQLMELIDDIDSYELPERLPNGDIIIRRKPSVDPVPAPEGEIDI